MTWRATSARPRVKASGDPAAVAAAAAAGNSNDALLHTLLKCFHHTVAAYMPTALAPSLQRWLEILVKILEQAGADTGPLVGST